MRAYMCITVYVVLNNCYFDTFDFVNKIGENKHFRVIVQCYIYIYTVEYMESHL